jgi:selenocysteine lyase/cysteine desulfurase
MDRFDKNFGVSQKGESSSEASVNLGKFEVSEGNLTGRRESMARLDAFRQASRREMPICEKYAYFDHAAVAPLPQAAGEAIQKWVGEAMWDGDVVWMQWASQLTSCRELAARLIAASTDEIALIPNTTLGIHYIAAGIPWKPGDGVLAVANEFPSNLLAWKQLSQIGVDVSIYQPESDGRIDLERLLAMVTPATKLVAVSWVGFSSGYRINPGELAVELHRRGVLLLLDSIQGLGVFDLNVQRDGVDFAVADGHKWMLGPEGAGVLYIRREHLEWLRPVGVGWNSVRNSFTFSATELDWRESAARYEGGSHSMVGFVGLSSSLAWMQRMREAFGERIWEESVLDNTQWAVNALREAGATVQWPSRIEQQSGIVSFSWRDEDPQMVRQRCLKDRVVLSCRLGRLRISPHGYNNRDDVERLIQSLRK